MKNLLKKTMWIMLFVVGFFGALLLGGFLGTIGDYPVPATIADDPSVPHLQIGGRLFHSETFGDPINPVVIVVHGGPGWDYRSLLPLNRLADEFFVVFYDQQGAGLSPRIPSDELSLESALADLDSIVDYYGQGRPVAIVGHSWGAMLASAYIGQHPGKVRHAVLAEPGFLTTEMVEQAKINFGPVWETGFLLHATRIWFESLHIEGPDEDAAGDYFIGRVAPYANPDYYCEGNVPEQATTIWRAGARAGEAILGRQIDASGRLDINLVEGIERFREKVLFLAGECSSLGRRHQEKQARYFPQAEVVVVEGSGHMMFAEKPDESIRAVRDYLNARSDELNVPKCETPE